MKVIFNMTDKDTGEAVRLGGRAAKELGAMESYKNNKNRHRLCLFLFINNVDLKSNNRNH